MKDETGKVGIKGIVKGGMTNKGKVSFNNVSYPSLSQKGVGDGSANNPKQEQEIQSLKAEVLRLQKEKEELKDSLLQEQENAIASAAKENFAKGEEQGKFTAEATIAEKIQALQADVASAFKVLGEEKEKFCLDLLKGSQQMVLEIMSKLVGPLADDNREIIKHAVQIALSQLGNESNLKIYVSPLEHDYVNAEKGFWVSIDKSVESLEVIADERITAGGCMIETEAGSIDARCETMLSQMKETVKLCFQKQEAQRENKIVTSSSEALNE